MPITTATFILHTHARAHTQCTDISCFTEDVKAIVGWGFDGVKLDGCGREENVELWYQLLNWTQTMAGKKGIMIGACCVCVCARTPHH